MTMPTGHPRESDLRWTASPMWLAMMDAAVACGVEDRMDEARITDAKVWARIGDKNWPSEDQAVRDRFHALWTANVQARCGLDPDKPANGESGGDGSRTPRVPNPLGSLTAAEADAIGVRYRDGETILSLAECFEVSRDRVVAILGHLGIPRRPKWHDKRVAGLARAERVMALAADGLPTARIAATVGLTVNHVTVILREHGIRRHGSNQYAARQEAA